MGIVEPVINRIFNKCAYGKIDIAAEAPVRTVPDDNGLHMC